MVEAGCNEGMVILKAIEIAQPEIRKLVKVQKDFKRLLGLEKRRHKICTK